MSETVQLFQKTNGTFMFTCAVDLAQHVYQPLARPDPAGVWLWCRHCRPNRHPGNAGTEHCLSWSQLLAALERIVPPEERRDLLAVIERAASRDQRGSE